VAAVGGKVVRNGQRKRKAPGGNRKRRRKMYMYCSGVEGFSKTEEVRKVLQGKGKVVTKYVPPASELDGYDDDIERDGGCLQLISAAFGVHDLC
jgi:hypothetical protein